MIWKDFTRYQLHEKMRVTEKDRKREFMEWLLSIGEGKTYSKFEKENDLLEIPRKMIIKEDITDKI